jgi:UDP-2,3-diacylglucosamine hydrolase
MDIALPPAWRRIDVISDIHLQASEPATFALWRDYLLGTQADALFILGDLFEVWVGDDALDAGDAFAQDCVELLLATSTRLSLHIMVGNRDFLLGEQFFAACHARRLDDPTVLDGGDLRIALTHGDALCLDDTAYQQFRAVSRSPQWRADFLAQPLAQRRALAQRMRAQSESHKRDVGGYTDVTEAAVQAQLAKLSCQQMVHGHTHQPAVHAVAGGGMRSVLSDWDAAQQPLRGDVLRLELLPQARCEWSRLTPATAAKPAD